MEPEFPEGVGLEDRTAEVVRLLEKQPTSVVYVTGTCGVGKSSLGMRVGQEFARQVGEPFWAIDLSHAAPTFPLAQQVANLLGKSSPGAREGRGVLLLDNVDEALVGCGLLPGSTGLWSTATAEGINPPRLLILTATPRGQAASRAGRSAPWDCQRHQGEPCPSRYPTHGPCSCAPPGRLARSGAWMSARTR